MQGKPIRTVAGLAQGTVLHPVQQAFCDHDGLKCGFCTPGFVMSAVALLEKNPTPTPAQAQSALDGNICRCGTYPRVLEAVLEYKGGASWLRTRRSQKSDAPAEAATAREIPVARRAHAGRQAHSTRWMARSRSPARRSTPTTSTVPGGLHGAHPSLAAPARPHRGHRSDRRPESAGREGRAWPCCSPARR